jgi:hypothetical protein
MTHRYREHWVNVAHVAHCERGTRPNSLLLIFDTPNDLMEALAALCTGQEMREGGVRHDNGKHCPVHPDHLDDH